MSYKAVIFDLDGVICSTDRYHREAWAELAHVLGIPFDNRINNRLRGLSRQDSLEILLKDYPIHLTVEQKNQLLQQKNTRFKELLETITPSDLSPGVRKVMDGVKERGLKMAIGSSSKNALQILDRLGIRHEFDTVSDGNNITRAKPHPEVFLNAAGYMGIEPESCLVIEDAKAGVLAALAAKMHCVAVGDAARYHLANYNINDIKEVLNILDIPYQRSDC
jgi:beta-phosphoglucomutase